MNEPELKVAAFALAEATPRHLDQPTTPPIHWRLEGDPQSVGTCQLRVLLADGRTIRAPYSARKVDVVVRKLVQMPTRDQADEMTHAVLDLPPASETGYESPAHVSPTKARSSKKS